MRVSSPIQKGVLPCPAQVSACVLSAGGNVACRAANTSLAPKIQRPFCRARTPPPGIISNCSTGAGFSPCRAAALTTACANGCWDGLSTLAHACQKRPGFSPGAKATSVTCGAFSVNVPVLSNTTQETRPARSNAAADLIKMPRRAPTPVPTIIAVGVANPNAQGHAITSTAIKRCKATSNEAPATNHPANVQRANPNTTGTKTALTLSARRAMGALEVLASSTSLIMAANAVSAPVCKARISK